MSNQNEPKKLKRVVLKEEFIALTKKVNHAIVLNQMIYWSERTKDAKKFAEEEMARARKFSDGSVETEEEVLETLLSGWIYKSSEELIEDTMLSISRKTMDRLLDDLVESKWLSRRRNPKYKWDKTWQYRVDLNKIQSDLKELGYPLDGYTLPVPDEKNDEETNDGHDDPSNGQNDLSNGQNDLSMGHDDPSNGQNDLSNGQNDLAIPEITNKDYNQKLQTVDYSIFSSSSVDELEASTNLSEKEEEEEINKHVIDYLANHLNYNSFMIDDIVKHMKKNKIRSFTKDQLLKQHRRTVLWISENKKEIREFGMFFVNGILKHDFSHSIITKEKELEKLQQENTATKNSSNISVPFFNWLEN